MEVDVHPVCSVDVLLGDIEDVTRIDLAEQVRRLLASLNVISPEAPTLDFVSQAAWTVLRSVLGLEPSKSSDILQGLSEVLAIPGLLDPILDHFGPLTLDLFARWSEGAQELSAEESERKLFVLAEVASLRPEYWSIVYDFLERTPFLSGTPLAHISVEETSQGPHTRLLLLLLTYYRILGCDAFITDRHAWNAAPLVRLLKSHPDVSVRYMALQTYVRFKGIQERVRLDMEKQYVGDIAEQDVEIPYRWEVRAGDEVGQGSQLELVMSDGWMIRLHEATRVEAVSKRSDSFTLACLADATSLESTSGSDFSSRTALIAGSIVFQRCSSMSTGITPEADYHIDILSHKPALRALVSLLSWRLPILLTSPPSAGKTHTVRHLASVLYPSLPLSSKLLTISLADTSVDAKALLGNYVSSPSEPGTFVWAEGALVKAMRTGRWIILEDLDRATVEIQSLFARLADSLSVAKYVGTRAVLHIAGQPAVVEASQDFAIIATRTKLGQGAAPLPSFLGAQYYHEVQLPAPDATEVEDILSRKYPTLAGAPIRILYTAYQQITRVGNGSMHRSGRSSRPHGLRDLERWCSRVTRVLSSSVAATTHQLGEQTVFSNPVVQEEVFLEAFDIFLASLDTSQIETRNRREAFGGTLANAIGLNTERYRWLMDSRVPSVEITGDKRARQSSRARVGRVNLHGLAPRPHHLTQSSRPFAMTKPSALLLERIAVGVNASEPMLLVGETGTGKTTAVQHLADTLERPLTVLNLSMQTESGDLIGGFKPVEAAIPARELHGKWVELFRRSFSRKKNEKFETAVRRAVHETRWKRVAEMLQESAKLARAKLIERLDKRGEPLSLDDPPVGQDDDSMHPPAKRRKLADDDVPSAELRQLVSAWDTFLPLVDDFVVQHVTSRSRLVFAFMEGPLIKCLRNGEWLLLDEVNLASHETLESLSAVLESSQSSVILAEKGDLEPVSRHPGFRLFACMNPATDIGKKDLPVGIRGRFTEVYVPPPDDDREALLSIIKQYLGDACAGDSSLVLDVAEFYVSMKALARAKQIVDGTNTPPHYSMRTLARALTFAVDVSRMFGVRRGLWEGCIMTFTMSLDQTSAELAKQLCDKCLLRGLRNANAVISHVPAAPIGSTEESHTRFGHYWLAKGPEAIPPTHDYIVTPSVQAKLLSLARTIMTRKYPVLIQGPTSSGKTSAVEFMARQTGHKFIRINNHEHTDIQEYLGSYTADPITGKLAFQEGALVNAVRHGHWIVLDELNLAPTDVLEALNRLLDDNRELVLPETQEVVKPHPNFMLFATQNPPGLYAGRKVLSRAFRNRFLELHFEDVPQGELETILGQRCRIPPSYASRIVQVFRELQHRRQATRVFEASQSFATLRDLFRWANRDVDSYQQLADHGYMLLAERSRSADDKAVVREVLETIMKVKVDESSLYDVFSAGSAYGRLPGKRGSLETVGSAVVWTSAMRKLFTLTALAYHYREPLLLVGETGCGKTSVCQVLAGVLATRLIAVNCHQNMEAADLLGSQRPVRDRSTRLDKATQDLAEIYAGLGSALSLPEMVEAPWLLSMAETLRRRDLNSGTLDALQRLVQRIKALDAMFEWHNGPLVEAMRDGALFLLDELSLADDSVLERLNSVLEPGRTLHLAEKGGGDEDANTLTAVTAFGVIATMNPGGDFGKKELSPALRNRFTEVWVPQVDVRADLDLIVAASWKVDSFRPLGPLILDFLEWFDGNIVRHFDSGIGLRDVLSWILFTEACSDNAALSVSQIFIHGAKLAIVDGLESLPTLAGSSPELMSKLRGQCLIELERLIHQSALDPSESLKTGSSVVEVINDRLLVNPFELARNGVQDPIDLSFALQAPTTRDNLMRVVRACQLPKGILLEGSPGVGKTSLVAALASLCGRDLCRINLSEQTDLVDLFGADLPVVGETAGTFAWVDAGFLAAMKRGDWVLLDEMNLASQAVLEGLNAVLDHRGSVYIPELGREFFRHPAFRVFAAQNPLHQGGGRKGLPKSFLNRFTKVYIQEMTREDLDIICSGLRTTIPQHDVASLITMTRALMVQTGIERNFGSVGSPWEFNLRDIMRVASLADSPHGVAIREAVFQDVLGLVFVGRFRTQADQERAAALCETHLARKLHTRVAWSRLTPMEAQSGITALPRLMQPLKQRGHREHKRTPMACQAGLMTCLSVGTLAILVGARGCGKREVVRAAASSVGQPLVEFSVHPGVDTLEMLGSYEQGSTSKDWLALCLATLESLASLAEGSPDQISEEAEHLSAALKQANQLGRTSTTRTAEQVDSEIACAIDQAMEYLRVCLTQAQYKVLSAQRASLHRRSGKASFEWVDGPLISALQAGDWFLISDANLCSASVLDRLNSLCEVGASLSLSEKGTTDAGVPTFVPHPNFRLIMAFDPLNGELSRAMRNRGIEIYFDGREGSRDEHRYGHQRSSRSQVHYESSIDGEMFQDFGSLTPLPTTRTSKCAYMLASRTLDGISSLGRWLRLTDLQTVPEMEIAVLRQVFDWRSRRLSSLHDLQDANSSLLASLPLDYTINRYMALAPDLRIIFRLLEVLLCLSLEPSGVAPMKQHVPGPSDELRTLLKRLQAEMRLELRSRLARSLHGGSEPEGLMNDVAQAATILDYMSLLNNQIAMSALDFTRIIVVARAIKTIIPDLHYSSPLSRTLQQVDKAVAITNGKGQMAIWIGYAGDCSSRTDIDFRDRLSGCLARPLPKTLRQSILKLLLNLDDRATDDIMFLNLLKDLEEMSTVSNKFETPALALRYQWKIQTQVDPPTPSMSLNAPEQGLLLRARLLLLARPPIDPVFIYSLTGLMSETQPASNLQEWGTIVYASTNTRNGCLELQAVSAFLLTVFAVQSMPDDAPLEAGLTNSPVFTMAIASMRFDGKTSIGNIAEQEHRLEFCRELLLRSTVSGDASTADLWGTLGFALLSSVLRCFNEVSMPPAQTRLDWAANWQRILRATVLDVPRAALETWIGPLFATDKGLGESLLPARLWTRIGIMLWDLYVPNIPYDPAQENSVVVDVHELALQRLDSEADNYRAVERSRTGEQTTEAITAIMADIETLGASPTIPAVTRKGKVDPALLNAFFAELHALGADLVSPAKLLAFEQLLEGEESREVIARASALQASLSSVMERMKSTYIDLPDLIGPVSLAISSIRVALSLGLATHKLRAAQRSKPFLVRAVKALSAYPAITGRKEILRVIDLPPDVARELRPAESALIGLAVRSRDYRTGHALEGQLEGVISCYDRLLALWQIDEKRRALTDQASESMYRQRKKDHDVLSDEAEENTEFRKLFSYEEDDQVQIEQSGGIEDVARPTMASGLTQGELDFSYRLHMDLFGGAADTPEGLTQECDSMWGQIIMRSIQQDVEAFDVECDIVLKPFNLKVMAEASRNLKPTASTASYDFYQDANLLESNRGSDLARRLAARLEALLLEWPEQMVLQHIKDRCDNMSRMTSQSSVARLLPAFEQLLEHTNDWEGFANKQNSLQGFRDEIVGTIVSWRKLELSMWHRIIPQQTTLYEGEVSEWFLKLYEMLVVALRTAEAKAKAFDTSDGMDQHLNAVHVLLNEFMVSASAGHFAPRLRLLESFARLVGAIYHNRRDREAGLSHRLENLIVNLVRYYHQYEGAVTSQLDSQKRKLEQSVQDFVRLASWKDTNVQALKASAHKSHVQLFKLIRKHKDVLRQRVAQLLVLPQLQPMSGLLRGAGVFANTLHGPALKHLQEAIAYLEAAGVISTLSNLPLKAKVFSSKTPELSHLIDPSFSLDLEAYVTDVRDQLATLETETGSIKGSDSAKLAKNLLTRKRRALADGMKELREMGFSYKVRSDSLARQTSTAQLHQLGGLSKLAPEGGALHPALYRIEEYQHRLEVLMPQMRSALADHHASLTTNDLIRVHGMVDSLFEAALSVRSRLAQMLPACTDLANIKALLTLAALSTDEQPPSVIDIHAIRAVRAIMLDAVASVRECTDRLRDLGELRSDAMSSGGGDTLHARIAPLLAVAEKLEAVGPMHRQASLQLVSFETAKAFHGAPAMLAELSSDAVRLISTTPSCTFLLDPARTSVDVLHARCQTIVEQAVVTGKTGDQSAIASSDSVGDALISQLLVALQGSVKDSRTVPIAESDGPPFNYKTFIISTDRSLEQLRLNRIVNEADRLIEQLHIILRTPAGLKQILHQANLVLPFLTDYLDAVSCNLHNLAAATKATYKTCHLLCKVAMDLSSKGFCLPEDQGQKDGQEQDASGASEATGFGQGAGQDNVTDTIEDEAQVEGLQGEDDDQQEQDRDDTKEGEDDSHEMQEDFEGALEDAAQRSEDNNEDGDDDLPDPDDADDHVGDVGTDAVDEQFWSGEQDGPNDDGEKPMDPGPNDEGSTDLSAKEPPKDPKSKDKQKTQKDDDDQPDEIAPESAETEETETEMDDAGEQEDDSMNQDESGQTLRDENRVPEVDPLALPDDLDMDDKQDAGSAHDSDDMASIADDEESMASGQDDSMAADNRSNGDPDEQGSNIDPEDRPTINEETVDQDPHTAESNNENDGAGAGRSSTAAAETEENAAETDPMDSKADNETGSEADGTAGAKADGPSGTQDGANKDEQIGDSGALPEAASDASRGDTRSFGRSLADVRRLMSEIMEQTGQDRKETGASAAEQQAGAQEHVSEEQDADMEALGAADESHQNKLADLQIVDQEATAADEESQAMEVDEKELPRPASTAQPDMQTPKLDDSPDGQADKALTRAQVGASGEAMGGQAEDGSDTEGAGTERKVEPVQEEVDDPMAIIETGLDQLTSAQTEVEGKGIELWRNYSAMTNDLSFQLCEQMRLILEPTLATRLQGDFRSGKRLNMRKIIPYIASEYTKDKIWLRRTKPSRREYQVLLSLDDSRSMADSESVHLAYQTMALVSQALSKLEVGQISVARFGDSMEVLHPFSDAGFNARDGAKVMGSFSFEQHRTDVAKLLDGSLEYLQESRRSQASNSAADLWQLEIIISDGVCQDHPRLRTLLRKAIEQRVMVVFLVVDSLSRQSAQPSASTTTPPISTSITPTTRQSILNMQSVSYKSVNGEMKLEMERYLDTFPFEYYVVLRDVQALPEVLSDTLRQWMARVSSSEE